MKNSVFHFQQFDIHQDKNSMKVGTDGILLGAWANCENKKEVLDIGTGTGLLALMIAQQNEACNVDAVEIDASACEEAEQNFAQSSFKERVKIYNTSIQDFSASAKKKYDLIISNPPFFTGGTMSNNMDRKSVRHTIKLSHADLLRAVSSLLEADGSFAMIVPFLEGLRFIEFAENYNLHLAFKTKVYGKANAKIERLLLSFVKQKGVELVEDSLVVYDDDNTVTAAYNLLTKDFYLQKQA